MCMHTCIYVRECVLRLNVHGSQIIILLSILLHLSDLPSISGRKHNHFFPANFDNSPQGQIQTYLHFLAQLDGNRYVDAYLNNWALQLINAIYMSIVYIVCTCMNVQYICMSPSWSLIVAPCSTLII